MCDLNLKSCHQRHSKSAHTKQFGVIPCTVWFLLEFDQGSQCNLFFCFTLLSDEAINSGDEKYFKANKIYYSFIELFKQYVAGAIQQHIEPLLGTNITLTTPGAAHRHQHHNNNNF